MNLEVNQRVHPRRFPPTDSIPPAEDLALEPKPLSQFDYTMSCLPGIAFAGMAYPFAAGLIGIVVLAAESLGSNSDWTLSIVEMALIAFLSLFIISLFGLFIGLMCGMVSLLLVNAINWITGNVLGPVGVVSCAGGLAGFIPTAAFLFPVIKGGLDNFDIGENVTLILLGPFLATFVGQTGAQLWESRKARLRFVPPVSKRKIQFKISHILIATFCCALLLGLLKAFPDNGFVWAVLIYIVIQTLLFGTTILISKIRNLISPPRAFST